MTNIRMLFNDFTAMYQGSYNDLYHALLGANAKTEPGNVVIGFDIDRLKQAFRKRWDDFAFNNPTLILGATELPAEAPPPISAAPAKEDGLARLQREQREAVAETAKLVEDAANKRV